MFCYAEDVMMDKNIIFSQTPTHLQWKIGQSFMGIVAITLTGETVFLILFYRIEIFKQ